MILRQLTYGAHTKHMPQGSDILIETVSSFILL